MGKREGTGISYAPKNGLERSACYSVGYHLELWIEGTGLGKENTGMRSHIFVPMKSDSLGIGATEATSNWLTPGAHFFRVFAL